MMIMKRIHEAWRRHLNELEMKSDPNQIRMKVAKKMSDYLFSPLQIVDPSLDISMRASGNITSKYNFLYWAVFGTKEERMMQSGIYRPKLGLQFAKQKIDLLMAKLSDVEEKTLSTDIAQLIQIVKGKERIFEDIWKNRDSTLDDVEGFINFNLIKGKEDNDFTTYASHSTWKSEEYFINWTK